LAPARVQHQDRAAHRLVVALELLQHPLERLAHLGGAGENLADLLERAEPAQLRPRLADALRHGGRVGGAPLPAQVRRRICSRVRRFRQFRRTRRRSLHSWIWNPSWYEVVLGAAGGLRFSITKAKRVLWPSTM